MLEGLRVIDASRILAGPMAGQILADMGAEVLKLEPPGGDPTRGWGPPFQGEMATYFQCCNRNKSSLTLDLKNKSERATLGQLMDRADIFLHNFLPVAQEKFALTRESVSSAHPRLISMGISGFREGTIRENEAGYDLMLQAETGVMSLNGPPEGDPYKVGVAWIDALTGMMAANGALAALYRRERTGKGAFLSVSLYQTTLFSLVNVGSAFHFNGEEPRRFGNAHPNIVPYQMFHLADRALVIAVGNDRQYADLCRLLDLPLDYPSNRERVNHREELIARLEKVLAQRSSDALLEQLKAAKIPATPVFTVAESFGQVRGWDPDAVLAVRHEKLGPVDMTRFPVTGFSPPVYRAPPFPDEGGAQLAEAWLSK